VTVAVDHLESSGVLFELLVQRLDRLHDDIAAELGGTKAIGSRIELTGATAIHDALRREIDTELMEKLRSSRDGIIYFVDKVVNRSRPALDLERCAAEGDPPALLARLVIALEKGGAEAAVVVQRARRELHRIAEESGRTPLQLGSFDDDHVRDLLIASGREALEALLKQAASHQGGDGPA
jgi:hypothetical protein